jgi:hypothetical protein
MLLVSFTTTIQGDGTGFLTSGMLLLHEKFLGCVLEPSGRERIEWL